MRSIATTCLYSQLALLSSCAAFSLRDMSAWVEAEAAVRAAEVAEARARGKAAFLSTISHELRNPLNAVVGMTQVRPIPRLG